MTDGGPGGTALELIAVVGNVLFFANIGGERHQVIRRQLGSVAIFGVLAGAPLMAAPVAEEEPATAVSAPIAVQRTNLPGVRIRDEAAMVLVGTALIGVAAAVRRAA